MAVPEGLGALPLAQWRLTGGGGNKGNAPSALLGGNVCSGRRQNRLRGGAKKIWHARTYTFYELPFNKIEIKLLILSQ